MAVIRVYDDAGNVIQTHEHKAIPSNLVSSELRAVIVSDCEAKITPRCPPLHHGPTSITASQHRRVLAVAAKELQPRILDFVHAKDVIRRLNNVQDAASLRCDSRLR
jgi:hypothetical protein